MAIVDMKKCTIVGYGEEKEKILKTLHKSCCFEVVKSEELDNASYIENSVERDKINNKMAKLNFAFDFLKTQEREAIKLNKNKKVDYSYEAKKKPLISTPSYVDYKDFVAVPEKEIELFNTISDLEKINMDLAEIKSDVIKQKNLIEQVKIYKDIDCEFSKFKDTKNTAIMLGTISSDSEQILDELKKEYDEFYYDIKDGYKQQAIAIICHNDIKEEILQKLIEFDFTRCSYSYELTAKDKIKECNQNIIEIEKSKTDLLNKSLEYLKYIDGYKLVYDYYTFEKQKLDAKEGMMCTKQSFTLEGWIPAKQEKKITEKLNKTSENLVMEFKDPTDEEIPPTLTKNNKVVTPFECVTNMYSAPFPSEIDPNPFVAFFFFLFFGFMLSDAAYGIILTVGALLLYKLSKPAKGKGKIILVIAMCGLSTIFWGAIFGGWFGMTWNPLVVNGKSFAPMDNPLIVLGLSLGLGVIHILFGMGINAVALIKKKKYIAAIVEVFDWYFIFIGIGLFAVSKIADVSGLKLPALIVGGIGLVTLLVLGGYDKKGVGKVFGGVARLYDIINFMSDVLSYSRLFGLGLATGIVGMVFNKIAIVVMSLFGSSVAGVIFGIIFAIPILVVGHTFNIGINTLGAYVHDCRLQYIEFFGKFYKGGGHVFKPLGADIKYNNIKM